MKSTDTNLKIYISEEEREQLFKKMSHQNDYSDLLSAEHLETICLGKTHLADKAYGQIRRLLKQEYKQWLQQEYQQWVQGGIVVSEREAEDYAKDMIMRYELEQCSIPPRNAEHMRQVVTFDDKCNYIQRRFYRSLQDAKAHRLIQTIKEQGMKYKKIGKNKYKRVKSVTAGLILALLPLLVILLALVLNALIVLSMRG